MSKNENAPTFISGLGFHKLAKWSVCPRYPQRLEPANFEEGDIVFLNLEYFYVFLDFLRQNPPANRFVLITHNSDKCFDDNYYHMIQHVVTKVYALNGISTNPNVIPIPIGYRDHPYTTTDILVSVPSRMEKSILLYMNFELNTNMEKRTICMNHFIGYPWVVKEGFLKKDALPLFEFYKKMAQSKFVLSPEGTGIDCHRIYEAIYLNAIPIIKRIGKPTMDAFYSKLPLLMIEDWSEITDVFLETNYDRLYGKLVDWKENNPNWLEASFWIR
jgi:hypothetical protein